MGYSDEDSVTIVTADSTTIFPDYSVDELKYMHCGLVSVSLAHRIQCEPHTLMQLCIVVV